MKGQHEWIPRYGLKVCKRCGIVRRRDGNSKPCPGKVRIALRENRVRAAQEFMR